MYKIRTFADPEMETFMGNGTIYYACISILVECIRLWLMNMLDLENKLYRMHDTSIKYTQQNQNYVLSFLIYQFKASNEIDHVHLQ